MAQKAGWLAIHHTSGGTVSSIPLAFGPRIFAAATAEWNAMKMAAVRSIQPSSNVDSSREAAVVGTLLEIGNSELPPHLSRLVANAPESFDDLRHASIVSAIRSLRLQNEVVSPIAVLEMLSERDKSDGITGLLSLLPNEALPIGLAEVEAEKIWGAYQRRRMASLLKESTEALLSNRGVKTDDVAQNLRSALDDLTAETNSSPTAKQIGSLTAPAADDPSELLECRWLCRGAGLVLAGSSGIGKSTIGIQMGVSFSMGLSCLGIKPRRPLKILLVQAENDDGDLFEMFSGVCAGLELSDEDKKRAGQQIVFCHEDRRAGDCFLSKTVEPLLRKHHPDIVIIDPVLAYLPGDTNDAHIVGDFLRRGLNPLLRKYQCAALIVHHSTKAKADAKKNTHDFLYAGAGSSEFTNWARAVLVLETLGNGCYRLHAPKRGARIGWQNADGRPAFDIYIRHSRMPGRICWHEIQPDEIDLVSRTGKTKSDFLVHVPKEGEILQSVLLERSNASGIGRNKSRAFLEELLAEGTLHVSLVARKSTNPAKFISRQPQ